MCPQFTDDITLLNEQGVQTVFISGKPKGKWILFSPTSGPGSDGPPSFECRGPNNQSVITFGAVGDELELRLGSSAGSTKAALLVFDESGRDAIKLDAETATLRVGTRDNSGEILLVDRNEQTTIHPSSRQGDIKLLGADCAEDFDIEESHKPDPGTVMAIGEEGKLHQCAVAYDKKVASVVSGAGGRKPGIVLA